MSAAEGPTNMLKQYLGVAVGLALAGCGLDVDLSPSDVISARTVVSLTFDDTLADQVQVGDLAAAHGMRVTFFVNSPRFDTAGYMTTAQVIALEQQGHEIGGHTLSHANLPTLTDDDARTQVCNDRAALLARGFRVTSFAYPFGADNPTDQQIVADCGYNSARDVGGLMSAGGCSGCPWTRCTSAATASRPTASSTSAAASARSSARGSRGSCRHRRRRCPTGRSRGA